MDSTNIRILRMVNKLSSRSTVSPTEVNKNVKLNEIEFGDRLLQLRRLRYLIVEKGDLSQESCLPNGIHGISITEVGRQYLRRGNYL
jgi:hypothetical protein